MIRRQAVIENDFVATEINEYLSRDKFKFSFNHFTGIRHTQSSTDIEYLNPQRINIQPKTKR
jgi:hypothetical protein